MNSKAIAKSTAGLAVIVIILVAGLAGTVYYYSSRGPTGPSMTTASVPTPSFVGTNTYVAESGNAVSVARSSGLILPVRL